MGQSAPQSQFCIIPQVHLSVCPVKCGKWLIGYGCYLEWWVKWKDEEYRVLKWTCTYRMTHGTLNTATQPNNNYKHLSTTKTVAIAIQYFIQKTIHKYILLAEQSIIRAHHKI